MQRSIKSIDFSIADRSWSPDVFGVSCPCNYRILRSREKETNTVLRTVGWSRQVSVAHARRRTKAEKPFSLEKGHARVVSMFPRFGSLEEKGKPVGRREMLREKRANLAEGTSIIGQRPGFQRPGEPGHEFGRARVLTAPVVGFCSRRGASGGVAAPSMSPPTSASLKARAVGARAPKQSRARELVRPHDKPETCCGASRDQSRDAESFRGMTLELEARKHEALNFRDDGDREDNSLRAPYSFETLLETSTITYSSSLIITATSARRARSKRCPFAFPAILNL